MNNITLKPKILNLCTEKFSKKVNNYYIKKESIENFPEMIRSRTEFDLPTHVKKTITKYGTIYKSRSDTSTHESVVIRPNKIASYIKIDRFGHILKNKIINKSGDKYIMRQSNPGVKKITYEEELETPENIITIETTPKGELLSIDIFNLDGEYCIITRNTPKEKFSGLCSYNGGEVDNDMSQPLIKNKIKSLLKDFKANCKNFL